MIRRHGHRIIIALIVVAVTVSLLLSSSAKASLLAEVAPDHWSRQAIANLERSGLVFGRGGDLDQTEDSLSRYELARRVIDVLESLEWMAGKKPASGEFSPGEPLLHAYSVRIHLRLDQVKRLWDTLSEHIRIETGGEYEALLQQMADLEDRGADVTEPLIERWHALDQSIDQWLTRFGQVLDLTEDGVASVLIQTAPTLDDVIATWARVKQHSPATDTAPLDAETLIEDVRALVRELEFEINALGGSTDAFGTLMAPTRSYEWSAPTTSSVDSTPGTALSLSLFPSASGSSLWNPNGWTGHTDGHTARVEAVLPILGDRSRILATYSQPVDVDRIREATSVSQRWRSEDETDRLSVAGEVRIGSSASIRIGYETTPSRLQGSFIPESGTVEAGVEYSVGRRGRVQAGYSWGTGENNERVGADIGVGYDIAEHASILASFSMVRFDDPDGEAVGRSLGEAKLIVRF